MSKAELKLNKQKVTTIIKEENSEPPGSSGIVKLCSHREKTPEVPQETMQVVLCGALRIEDIVDSNMVFKDVCGQRKNNDQGRVERILNLCGVTGLESEIRGPYSYPTLGMISRTWSPH